MKTILVLAQNPELPDAVKTALDGYPCRPLVRPDLEEAEPLLRSGPFHACIVDADHPQIQLTWMIERLKELAPQIPIFVLTQTRSPDWEETLYLKGAARILSKPLRPRLLRHFLDSLPTTSAGPSRPARRPIAPIMRSESLPAEQAPLKLDSLTHLLPHAFSVTSLCAELLPKLRVGLGVQRIVLLLRPAFSLEQQPGRSEESRRMNFIASRGVSDKLLENCGLSMDNGAGALLSASLPILERDSPGVNSDAQAGQEMDLLGVDTLIALTQGEQILGALGLSRRLTDEPVAPHLLQSVYFLCEEVAQAIGQIWANERVVSNHEMMEGILRELNSACVVVDRNLQIVHANKAAQSLFLIPADASVVLKFNDLPSTLINRVFQILKHGQATPPFRYRYPEANGRQFQVTIIPFQSKTALLPISALIVLDDQTQPEQMRRLEVETANLRLVKIMADRLAHEIGNALVPVSTHQQLLSTRHKDPEFRLSLETALANSVKRIGRLVNQMVFLAQDRPVTMETVSIPTLLEEAFREAQRHLPNQTATLRQTNESATASVLGDHEALKHALAEVFINAIQANPTEAKVIAKTVGVSFESGQVGVSIEVKDNGEGFPSEASHHATDAFFTTRSVGLGLGLTVTRKVIETHQGRLEIVPGDTKTGGLVRVVLPLEDRRLL